MNDELSDLADNPYQSPREGRSGSSQRSARSTKSTNERVFIFSSVRLLGVILTALFALSSIVSVGVIVVRNNQAQLYQAWLNGRQVSEAQEEKLLAPLQLLSIAQLVFLLALATVFITWFYKAYVNLPPLGVKRLDPTPGWAIGGWFVPVFSLYQPFIIAKEIWINSCPVDVGKVGRAKRKPNTLPVLAWWLLWVSLNILGWVLTKAGNIRGTDDAQAMIKNALGDANGAITLEIVRILAAIGAVYFVLTISRWQDKRNELLCQLAEEPPAAEAPQREDNPYENY